MKSLVEIINILQTLTLDQSSFAREEDQRQAL